MKHTLNNFYLKIKEGILKVTHSEISVAIPILHGRLSIDFENIDLDIRGLDWCYGEISFSCTDNGTCKTY